MIFSKTIKKKKLRQNNLKLYTQYWNEIYDKFIFTFHIFTQCYKNSSIKMKTPLCTLLIVLYLQMRNVH